MSINFREPNSQQYKTARKPWQTGTIIVSVLTAISITVVIWTRNLNDQVRATRLADTLLTVPSAGVPFILQDLHPIQHLARPRLLQLLSSSQRHSLDQLRAIYGLIEFDHSLAPRLLDQIASAPESECQNLIQALEHVKSSAFSDIELKSREENEPLLRARYAILALHLGSPSIATEAFADVNTRTAFIQTYRSWHGDSGTISRFLVNNNDPVFRSTLITAIATLESAERGTLPGLLVQLFNEDSHSSVHSALSYALSTWNMPIPKIEAPNSSTRLRRWYINKQGITMLEIPSGNFRMGTEGEAPFDDETPAHDVHITRPFLLADREVTAEQFLCFVADSDYETNEKPRDWPGLSQTISPSGNCPVQLVTWFDAILFCNWLSVREGHQKCYERRGKQVVKNYAGIEEELDIWNCDFTADGYRLPTESEWEYAARAGSSSRFCFGNSLSLLPLYAWDRNNSELRTWPGGLKRPNSWGLFDMHGNVEEWCWDLEGPYSSEAAINPTGAKDGAERIMRGGAAGTGDLACRSAFRRGQLPTFRSPWTGFRVCRSGLESKTSNAQTNIQGQTQ